MIREAQKKQVVNVAHHMDCNMPHQVRQGGKSADIPTFEA